MSLIHARELLDMKRKLTMLDYVKREKGGTQPFIVFLKANKGRRKVSLTKEEKPEGLRERISKRKECTAILHNADVPSDRLNTLRRLWA